MLKRKTTVGSSNSSSNSRVGGGGGSKHSVGKPVLVGELTLNNRRVVYCCGGEDNSGAVLNDGTMYMWGSTARGKLGIGSTDATSINLPHQVTFGGVNSMNSVRVVQCALGSEHTGCVTSTGATFMWGSGYYGKLGLGHTRNVYSPAQVRTLSGHPCSQISCGSQHTLAITKAGDLFAWGRGDERLGLNLSKQSQDVSTPHLNLTFRNLSLSLTCASAG